MLGPVSLHLQRDAQPRRDGPGSPGSLPAAVLSGACQPARAGAATLLVPIIILVGKEALLGLERVRAQGQPR